MDRLRRENLLLVVAAAVLVVGGYVFLRYAYRVADPFPFSQEIVLVVLGTIVTVLITALLLNKQTEVELEKEENLNFLDLKRTIYMDLLDHLQDILLRGEATRDDVIRLRFLSHKLALVASPDVLDGFSEFVDVFRRATDDRTIVPAEADDIMEAVAELTVRIRGDLVGAYDRARGVDRRRLSKRIESNTEKLSGIRFR